ncbi:MAG: DUF4864 domain-containing protein [Pseudomonadota bacterium]|nr:DUF4864 domain-containing protein [Pseudomonadota bacterium]
MSPARTKLPFLALLATLLLLVALPAGTASAADTPEADRLATQNVIEQQITAFQAGDHERAYSLAAPGVKSVFPTVERFIDMVTTGYKPVYDPESYVFGRSIEQSGTIHQEVLVTDWEGRTWQAVYTLARQEDGSWKITGVKLNPYKGVSA